MEQNRRHVKGIWIPIQLWERSDLSWLEKCLLSEIWSLSSDNGCYASNRYLANFLGSSPASVANMISNLRKKGLICDMVNDGEMRVIKVVLTDDTLNPQVNPPLTHRLTPLNPQVNIEYSIVNSIDNYIKDKSLIESANQDLLPVNSKKNNSIKCEKVTTKKSTGPAAVLDTSKFPVDWQPLVVEWIEYRKERKPAIKSQTELNKWVTLLVKLSNNDPKTAQEIVDTAIANGWQGIQPLKKAHGTVKQNPATNSDKMREWYGEAIGN